MDKSKSTKIKVIRKGKSLKNNDISYSCCRKKQRTKDPALLDN